MLLVLHPSAIPSLWMCAHTRVRVCVCSMCVCDQAVPVCSVRSLSTARGALRAGLGIELQGRIRNKEWLERSFG